MTTTDAHPIDLDAVKARHAAYREGHHPDAFKCCNAHDSAADVPALVTEVKRARNLLDWVRDNVDLPSNVDRKIAELLYGPDDEPTS